ncbi:hypothetical protein FPQ18DRAFT_304904 [Pyronema domesticum]|nr:hypothetical protein FPQ18DRAFT_304904 [Pyronema domesticum]
MPFPDCFSRVFGFIIQYLIPFVVQAILADIYLAHNKECSRWTSEIRDLWKRVSRDVGWRRTPWKPISRLFREEKAEEAVLEFLRRTGVGKMNGAGGSREDGSEEQSDEEWGGQTL